MEKIMNITDIKMLKVCLLFLFFYCWGINSTIAQQACSASGIAIYNHSEFGHSAYALGDVQILNTGIAPASNNANWYLDHFANIELMGALIIDSGAVVRLKSGARLSVYGDVINKGHLIIEPDAAINFYGKLWQNDSAATVRDGFNNPNTFPGGKVNFIAPRPEIAASVNAAQCVLEHYSGGNFEQQIAGGGVPMDISLVLQNENNVALQQSALKISGALVFGTADADLFLNDQQLIFTEIGNYQWDIPDMRAAFIVINDTLAAAQCISGVVKEGVDSGSFFVFPIGWRERLGSGARDYSPVIVQNLSAANTQIIAEVKPYTPVQAAGVNVPPQPADPSLNHLWRVRTDGGGPLAINMLHSLGYATNSLQNLFLESNFNSVFQINDTHLEGDGPRGLGSGAGTTGGSNVYSFPKSATGCIDSLSWYYKLMSNGHFFQLRRIGCSVEISADLGTEQPDYKLEVIRKAAPNSSDSTYLGTMVHKGRGSYSYTDIEPMQNQDNYYLVKIKAGTFLLISSEAYGIFMDCSQIGLFPNPAKDYVYINGLRAGMELVMYSMEGRRMLIQQVQDSCTSIDLRPFAAGAYNIMVLDQREKVALLRVVKQ